MRMRILKRSWSDWRLLKWCSGVLVKAVMGVGMLMVLLRECIIDKTRPDMRATQNSDGGGGPDRIHCTAMIRAATAERLDSRPRQCMQRS